MKVWNNGERVAHDDLNSNFAFPTPTLVKVGPTGGVNAGYNIAGNPGNVEDFIKDGGFWCASPVSSTCAMFFSQSSSPTPTDTGMGGPTVDIFTLNNADSKIPMWGLYIEPRRSANAWSTIGCEINPINFGSVVTSTPYVLAPVGTVANLQLTSGRPDVPGCQNNSYAMAVAYNGAAFDTGIIFGYQSLTSSTDGAKAIVMATSHSISWMGINGNTNAIIRSDSDSTVGAAEILFTNTGLSFIARNGTDVLDITSTGINVTGAAAVSGAFNVTGAVGFGSTLAVTGRVDALDAFFAHGAVTHQGTTVLQGKTTLTATLVLASGIQSAANDAAAATAGVALTEVYINSSTGALTTRRT